MSGGKSASRDVPDFLLSVQYAICWGTVHSINQIWVKDKPILCGQYTENSIETVYLPDLFGGDDAEGGVDGVVEMYMGTEDQLISEALAARYGDVPANLPGHQKVSFLFFRGATSGLSNGALNVGTDDLDGETYSRDNGRGFRWTSNNPYFPATKVHVTHFSEHLGLGAPAIPSIAGVTYNSEGEAFYEDADNGYQSPFYPGILFAAIFNENEHDNTDFWAANDGANYTFEPYSSDGPFQISTTYMGGDPSGASEQPYVASPTGRPRLYFWNKDVDGINQLGSDDPHMDNGGYVDIPSSHNPLARDGQPASAVVGQWEYDLSPSAVGIDSGYMVCNFSANLNSFAPGAFKGSGSIRAYFYVNSSFGGSKGQLVYSASASHSFVQGGGAYGLGVRFDVAYRLPPGTRAVYIEIVVEDLVTGDDVGLAFGETLFYAASVGVRLGLPISGGPNPDPTYAYCLPNGNLEGFPDDNPSAMIYDALVDTDWGKGDDPINIDTQSFVDAANLFLTERMGMSHIWVRQETIQDYIQDILDHVKAFLFINPMTGLYQIRPLRFDYDAASRPLLDETNCVAKKRKRRAPGELINEIVVSYTDPTTEEAVTVSAQDDGSIAQYGDIVSETREYSGFRNAVLAKTVAERDVRESSYPLFSCILEVNRTFWNVLPGDVFRFSWAKDDITEMVVRVMAVNYGKPKSKKMTLSVVEDIFSLDQTTYGTPPDTVWTPQDDTPVPFDYELAVTVPFPALQKSGLSDTDIENRYPGVAVSLHGDHESIDAVDFEVWTSTNAGQGTIVTQSIATVFPTESAALTVALPDDEVTSLIPVSLIDFVSFGLAQIGDVFMIGDSEANHELVMLDSVSGDDWVVIRGLWDTIIKEWVTGSRIWHYRTSGGNYDPVERTPGETRTYRFLPRTSVGRIAYADADDVSLVVSQRPHVPFRPANTQLDGNGFDDVHFGNQAVADELTATWENRNRFTEDATALHWDSGNVAGEPGQTTTLRLYDDTDTLDSEITGLTGTSHTFAYGALDKGHVEFVALNANGASLWNAKRYFNFRTSENIVTGSPISVSQEDDAVSQENWAIIPGSVELRRGDFGLLYNNIVESSQTPQSGGTHSPLGTSWVVKPANFDTVDLSTLSWDTLNNAFPSGIGNQWDDPAYRPLLMRYDSTGDIFEVTLTHWQQGSGGDPGYRGFAGVAREVTQATT